MSEESAEVVQYSYGLDRESELTVEVRSCTYDRHGERIANETRIFDPTVGRWVTHEPQAFEGGDANP